MASDPFAKARQAKATQAALKPAGAPGASPMPKVASTPEAFPKMAKRFGLDHSKLDKNPAVARVQMHQHLASKMGKDYMKHPAVQGLITSFNAHIAGAPKAGGGVGGTVADMTGS